MEIFVNNKPLNLPELGNIPTALQALGIDSVNGIALAVNDTVVPKAMWGNHQLQPGDKLTLIKATQGG